MKYIKTLIVAILMSACNNEQSPKVIRPNPKFEYAIDSATDIKKRRELGEYFKERNTTYCEFYKEMQDMESNSIRISTTKYPNGVSYDVDVKQINYIKQLDKEGKKMLLKKYNTNDSIYRQVILFGITYCK